MADILVLGATGYSGRLTARYLSQHPQRSSFTLAVAGRSRSKLDALELDAGVQVFVVDVTDETAVEELVKQFKVIANTVGPYWRWGTPVVKACAKHGVHYVDLTGETVWIYEIIHLFDYLASQTRSIIIPSCGFDSVPSDAVVFLANKTLKAFAGPDSEIENSVSAVEMKGGVAGGTLSTITTMMEEVPKNKLALARRQYSLSPVLGQPSPPPRFHYTLPSSSPVKHGGLFLLASGNRAVVQRTWGLQQYQLLSTSMSSVRNEALAYGPQFKYEEFLVKPNAFVAVTSSLTIAIGMFCLAVFSPVRWLFKRLVTQPGQGPPDHTLKDGFFEYTNITTSVPALGSEPTRARTIIRGNGDPGLLLTAAMLGESALALALDQSRLPPLAHKGGVLTPMSALGDVLIDRLRATGDFAFDSEIVLEETQDGKKFR